MNQFVCQFVGVVLRLLQDVLLIRNVVQEWNVLVVAVVQYRFVLPEYRQ